MRYAWSAATGGPDRPAAAEPRQREACCTSAGGLGGQLLGSGDLRLPSERAPSQRREARAGRSLPSKHSARDAVGGSRRPPAAWARSPDGDHRHPPEGTRDEGPAAVRRSAPGRSRSALRHRTAACGIARPQRAKPRGLRGWRCAAACPGPTRPRRPVATTGPAGRRAADPGVQATGEPKDNCGGTAPGHVVSISSQRDRTAEVRPRGATQPRT
jgi:hypothetical protein